MDIRKEILKKRTLAFSVRIMALCDALPKTGTGARIANQVFRSGTSVGAQYAESCRAKSAPDFISKVEGAMQELEETSYWLDLAVESGKVKATRLISLRKEISELMSIFVTMVKNTKNRGRA